MTRTRELALKALKDIYMEPLYAMYLDFIADGTNQPYAAPGPDVAGVASSFVGNCIGQLIFQLGADHPVMPRLLALDVDQSVDLYVALSLKREGDVGGGAQRQTK